MLRDLDRISCSNGSAVAMGNFDGFHLGHQRIMETLLDYAGKNRLDALIITFIPNPRIYFNQGARLITSHEQRKEFFDRLGVQGVLFLHFPEILNMSAESFVRDVLIAKLNMKHMVMGENFRFGKNRDGDIESLGRLGKLWRFDFTLVPSLVLDGVRISSSLIRDRLGDGEIEDGNRMLGRLYFIDGVVVPGDRVGRQMGFPTINIQSANTLLPEGVFETCVELSGLRYPSITYIGSKPTFNGREKRVETHIFDLDRDLYGQPVRLYFTRKIREDKRFDTIEELMEQIKNDIDRVKS